MGRGGEILHPFEISGSEDDNIRIVFVFFGHEGNGIAAVLVVKSELYPLVKGRELQVVVGFGGKQRVSAFVDETVVITQCAT
mgnify:FL=1